MKLSHIYFYILFPFVLFSCSTNEDHERLKAAEAQVTQSADSCAQLLEGIDVENLIPEDRALHGLVSSWLLYRQYAKEIPEEPLQTAFDFYHDSKDPLRRAQVYFLRSVIHRDQKRGTQTEWVEDLYSACLAIEKTNDYLLAAQIYQNYCALMTHSGKYDEGKMWVDKFVEAARKSGNTGEYLQALIYKTENSMKVEEIRLQQKLNTTDGNVIAKHTQFQEAFATIYKALGVARDKKIKVAEGRIYNQLSILHSRKQNLDSILYYARLSVHVNEQLHAQGLRKEATNYVLLSDAFRKMGQADSAIYYAQKTLNTPDTPLRNKRVAAQMLYNIYEDLKGDYKESLRWMRLFNQLTDSINKAAMSSNIDAAQQAAVKEQEKTVLKEENKHTMGWLLWSSIISMLIISAISVSWVVNRRNYHKQLQAQENDFNRMIAEMHRKLAEAKASSPDVDETLHGDASVQQQSSVIVISGSTKEKVSVEASSILYVTSESNYIKVYHLDAEGKVQYKMIRQTMTSIESQLSEYPHIMRCHRAFFVNLQHVHHATGSSSGLLLTLDVPTNGIPVSKTYISLIKARLQ